MAVRFTGAHVPTERMLAGVRWSGASPLRTRPVEARLLARGVHGDPATLNHWGIMDSPRLKEVLHRRTRPVWVRWRLAETAITVQGVWSNRDRVVDKTGQTRDGLLTAPREEHAATRCLTEAIRQHGVPAKSTIDGSAAHEAAITRANTAHGTAITIRTRPYVKTVVAQDPRAPGGPSPGALGVVAVCTALAHLGGHACQTGLTGP